jgi:hypothetical protein
MPHMSGARGDSIRSEPTIDTYLRDVNGGDNGFGAYQGRQVQSDELVLARNGINPITSQVGMHSRSGVLGTRP